MERHLGIRERFNHAAQLPHRRDADAPDDARLESPLGRLFYFGLISETEFNAGIKYGQISLRYLESIDAPAPYGDGEELRSLLDDDCFRRKLIYSEACELLRQAGRACKTAVDKIAIYGELPRDGNEWASLLAGLRALGGI